MPFSVVDPQLTEQLSKQEKDILYHTPQVDVKCIVHYNESECVRISRDLLYSIVEYYNYNDVMS